MKENGLTLEKARSRQYAAWTITDPDYADDIMLLANTPIQAKSLLHSQEQAAGSIGLYVNADETKYMHWNQSGDISTLNEISELGLVSHLLKITSLHDFQRNGHQLIGYWSYGCQKTNTYIYIYIYIYISFSLSIIIETHPHTHIKSIYHSPSKSLLKHAHTFTHTHIYIYVYTHR